LLTALGSFALGLAIRPETLSTLKEKFNEKEFRKTVREFDIAGELQALTESEAKYILNFGSIDSFRAKIIKEGKDQGRSDLDGVFKEGAQYQVAYHGSPSKWQALMGGHSKNGSQVDCGK